MDTTNSQSKVGPAPMADDFRECYKAYLQEGFKPVPCKGFNASSNPDGDYTTAKQPTAKGSGFTGEAYKAPALDEIEAWEKTNGWDGWLLPKDTHALDVEDAHVIGFIQSFLRSNDIAPGVHITNNGRQYLFRTRTQLSGSTRVFTKCGVEVTYRAGGKNYLILPPVNGRTWETWKPVSDLPYLPDEFLPYDSGRADEIVNVLSWQIGAYKRKGAFGAYEDLLAYLTFLLELGLSEERVQAAFQLIFPDQPDIKLTEYYTARTKGRLENGDPVIGSGTFIKQINDLGLDTIQRFTRELQRAVGHTTIKVENDWPDPVPFDEYSLLPDFPVDALPEIGKEIVEAVTEVNQIDPGLAGCLYLGVMSASCQKKAVVDLGSHREPLNLYLCPIYDSGNRKSSTAGELARPLYQFQKTKEEEMLMSIREALNTYKINEARLARLQRQAANDDGYAQRDRHAGEARAVLKDMDENPVPKSPVFLVDDVTPEALGVYMADNGGRIAVISAEGGLFDIVAGRYAKDRTANLDLMLKAHAGDYWTNHRIGREAKTMESPALTLCLTVQHEVIEEVGKNRQFRGRGLLARILYARCRSQVGYRLRQSKSIPLALQGRYGSHICSLMELPLSDLSLKLTSEAQDLWDEFYDDVEREMRPGGSLHYLPDWGSKLPGAVARIAGLLHIAQGGAKALHVPISVNIVSASCVIGAYFKEHAIAVFGLMKEDPRIKLARQILDYIKRIKPDTFKGRDVMQHTNISVMEDVTEGLRVLIDRGYIREEQQSGEKNRGRPESPAYKVNPKLVGKYA